MKQENFGRSNPGPDLSILFETSESNVWDAVSKAAPDQIAQDRRLAVAELYSELALRMPVVDWLAEQPRVAFPGVGGWSIVVNYPLRDDHWVIDSVGWRSEDVLTLEVSSARSKLKVSGSIVAPSPTEALFTFGELLEKLRNELVLLADEITRFNYALPYLISSCISVRLSGFPVVRTRRGSH